ncbi:hypothetical protein C818_00501 [Lachnospiraceae bacterium MD308]|nr:hypothetical protein C818_00501 [Lachnospiraceae bacterium MD308]
MGSLILCHSVRAKQPYEIGRIHLRIYTIEELCYYVCNNLYLIDHTIMNRQLCTWISTELHLDKLAEKLREELSRNCSEEQFVISLLRGSYIYAQSEINKIQGLLENLRHQKEVEKIKFKGDTLLKSGEYSAAVLVYQSIVNAEWDDSAGKKFYGHVYGCMGAAYGRLFLYEEALAAYKEAYYLCEEPDMLKAYLYCCYQTYSRKDYTKMLSGNPLFLSMASKLKEEMKEVQEELDSDVPEEKLQQWKNDYRRLDSRKGMRRTANGL